VDEVSARLRQRGIIAVDVIDGLAAVQIEDRYEARARVDLAKHHQPGVGDTDALHASGLVGQWQRRALVACLVKHREDKPLPLSLLVAAFFTGQINPVSIRLRLNLQTDLLRRGRTQARYTQAEPRNQYNQPESVLVGHIYTSPQKILMVMKLPKSVM